MATKALEATEAALKMAMVAATLGSGLALEATETALKMAMAWWRRCSGRGWHSSSGCWSQKGAADDTAAVVATAVKGVRDVATAVGR